MSQLPDIEQRFGVKFRWVPVNGKRIRSLRGADPFDGPPRSGQYDWTYRETDAAAWADYYGVDFREPENVEFDVELLLRAVIAAGQQTDSRHYAWALAREVFALGTWPLNQSVVERVAETHQLDMPAFTAALADPATQATLEANCAEAVSRGAFGTPSLYVGDDLFWGNDRLVLLTHRLSKQAKADQHKDFAVTGLDHVVLRSHAPERLAAFYTTLLDVPVERTVGDFLWQLRIGDSLLDIIRVQQADVGANMDHFCLRVSPYNEGVLLDKLHQQGVEGQVTGRIYGAQGFGPSIYFIDPQGNRVELKQHKDQSG